MKSILKSLMLIVFASMLFTSCDEKKKELREQVDKFNKACPVSLGDLMTINSVMYDGNTVEMKLTANESIASISALDSHKEEVKEISCISLSKESSDALVDKIIEAGANLKIIVVGGQSNTRTELELSANDLKTAKEKYSNMTDGQKLIASNVLGVKIKLPVMIDDMTKLVGLSLTADALVYKFEINDAETGQNIDSAISFVKYVTLSQMANSLKGGLIGERNRAFYQALIDCNQGVEHEYHELQTGKRAVFRISTDEIREVLNGKWDNQPSAKDWENFGNALEELEGVDVVDSVAVIDDVEDYTYTW